MYSLGGTSLFNNKLDCVLPSCIQFNILQCYLEEENEKKRSGTDR